MEQWPQKQFPLTVVALRGYATSLESRFVRLFGDLTRPFAFQYTIQRGDIIQQDNTRPQFHLVTQYSLHSIDILPWPTRSPGISPAEHF